MPDYACTYLFQRLCGPWDFVPKFEPRASQVTDVVAPLNPGDEDIKRIRFMIYNDPQYQILQLLWLEIVLLNDVYISRCISPATIFYELPGGIPEEAPLPGPWAGINYP